MPRVQRSELQEFLRRAKAAQRLQSGDRVCSRFLAVDSGGVDFLSGFRGPVLGDEDIITVIILGFSITLIFSWAFEITPEGR